MTETELFKKTIRVLYEAREALLASHGVTVADHVLLPPSLRRTIDNDSAINSIDEMLNDINHTYDKAAERAEEVLGAIGMEVIRAAAANSEKLSKELEEIFASIEARRSRGAADSRRYVRGVTAEPLNKPLE